MTVFYGITRTIEGFPNNEINQFRDSVECRDQFWRWNGVLTHLIIVSFTQSCSASVSYSGLV